MTEKVHCPFFTPLFGCGAKFGHTFLLLNIIKNIGLGIVCLGSVFGDGLGRPFHCKMVVILLKHSEILRCPLIASYVLGGANNGHPFYFLIIFKNINLKILYPCNIFGENQFLPVQYIIPSDINLFM